jgi:hypothetical protein
MPDFDTSEQETVTGSLKYNNAFLDFKNSGNGMWVYYCNVCIRDRF